MENERNLYHDLDSILYSREEIAAAVRALGERITADYRGKTPCSSASSRARACSFRT